jgi:hypothetical protein
LAQERKPALLAFPMFKTLFDISAEDPISQDLALFIAAACAFLIPFLMLIFWICFRNVFVGAKANIYLGYGSFLQADEKTINAYRTLLRNGGIIVLSIMSFVGLIFAVAIIGGTYSENGRYVDALKNRTALVAEGPIEQFQIYPTSREKIPRFSGEKTESFYVNNILFVYSRDFSDAGFEGNSEASLALSEAKYARVSYLNDPGDASSKKIILKLEVQ